MPDYERAEKKRAQEIRKKQQPQSDQQFAANLIAWHTVTEGIGEIPTELRDIAAGKAH